MKKNSKYIYFDHSATTPVLPEVVKEINDCFTFYYGNASEPHSPGRKAKEILEHSREVIGKSLGAKPKEIVFTGSGTESDNLAIIGVSEAYEKKGNHIITSEIEHPAVHMPLKKIGRRGFNVTYVPVDKFGMVDPQDVKKSITDNTILVTIMHANNIVGTIQPIGEIGKILREHDIIFHTDAVQTFTNIKTDVNNLNVDLLSISGHKIYGPKGVGALYIRKGTKIKPQILGGGHERGIRSSTENIPGIAGLAKAAELGQKNLSDKILKVTKMRDYLIKSLLDKIDEVKFNGHPTERLPGNCNFSFKYIEGESIVLKLDLAGIAASSGSACSSSSLKPSHTLVAMGLSNQEAYGSLRITLGFENTKEEIDYFLKVIPEIVSGLRKISPLYKKTV
ncbi:MAG: aminotransferase class V-fold PLP-dependent enzyme [Clostridia bacterium]|nr:aminotransferase class V-fold PLP-dependent enzyme [Clostridia bacterium]